VAVKADPSKTPVSCAKHFNDFRGLTCSHTWMSWTFPSVSTFLFSCLFMSQTEPVARHFFHKLTYTWLCENWWGWIFTTKFSNALSISFFPCISFDSEHMLFSSELHFSQNVHCLPHLRKTGLLIRITALGTSDTIQWLVFISLHDSFCNWEVA
jgi:hypothetical protein